MPRLQYVLRGIRSTEAKKSNEPPPKRLPVTLKLLHHLRLALASNPSALFDNVMLWSASLLCFFGFLRSGEITIPTAAAYDPTAHLSFSDISTDSSVNPSIIQVRIKASKTDPFRLGVHVHVGRTGNDLCPVNALLHYLSLRGTAPGILFHLQDGSPLTKSKFTSLFRKALSKSGIDSSSYSGHSFRIGAATTAAANGVEDSLIQTLGRWKSSAYLSYIRISPQNLAAISTRISFNS